MIIRKKKIYAYLLIFLLVITVVPSTVVAQGVSSFSSSTTASSITRQPQPTFQSFYGSETSTYWPILGDRATCQARTDLLLNVAPAGCSPTVVRSDLLAEQNVPVFCQIDAFEINPLVDVTQVRGIRFVGDTPPEVAGIGFHPARAALRSRETLLGAPLVNNIGYVVVVLKRQPIEAELPDFINLTLSAAIQYDSGNSLGVGSSEFLLKQLSDTQWENEKYKNGFWGGRYFLRLDEVDTDFARVTLYDSTQRLISTRVERGKPSEEIYVPGAYCRAGFQISYDGFVSAEKRARIEVSTGGGSADVFEVTEGSRFLNNQCSVTAIDLTGDGETGKVSVSCSGGSLSGGGRFDLSISVVGESTGGTIINSDKSGESWKYFKGAIADYETVADEFSNERNGVEDIGPTYGEDALSRGISLARQFGDNDVERRLINKFGSVYSDSEYAGRLNDLGRLDSSKAGHAIEVDGQTRVIRLLSLTEPDTKTNAELRVDGETFNIDLRERKAVPKGAREGVKLGDIVLERADPESIVLGTFCRNSNGVLDSNKKQVTLRLDGIKKDICGTVVSLARVNSESVAKIRLMPRAQGAQSLSNFTVSIGIEKRAFEITPEKARKRIDKLNKTIEEWEDTAEKLGDVVTGLKTACFATSALMTFKNFASGLSGESLARQQVMNGDGGWRARCQQKVADGEFVRLDACYTANSGDINAEVSTQLASLTKVNKEIKRVQEKHVTSGEGLANIFGSYVDSDAVRNDLAAYGRQEYGDVVIDLTGLRKEWLGADGKAIPSTTVGDVLSQDNVDNNILTTDAIREIILGAELKRSGVGGDHKKNVDATLLQTADRINENRIINSDLKAAKADELKGYPSLVRVEDPNIKRRAMPVSSITPSIRKDTKFTEATHVARVRVDSAKARVGVVGAGEDIFKRFPPGTYTLGLKGDSQNGVYSIVEVKQEGKNGQLIPKVSVGEFTEAYKLGAIEDQGRISLNNEIISADRMCRFYETEPYRGMPALIPFDVKNGWYAATRQTLPVFGGIGAFDASGRVTSFWLCNVGDNQKVEFDSGFGDDLCQQINLNTGQPLGSFPGLSQSEARNKINQATTAIQDAARQYPNKLITINGQRCEVGQPATGQPGTQCQDFMSPDDCHILFNVCDPVICPTSRCDFGGTYPVANVAQTGIVGSALLCLPNIKEGIVIPVCLTGIKAGIDGWVSIMRNHRDCLQENLDSGETVGICDQIYSVYVCEFFWGQVAPFVNVLIPKLIEVAYGQGVRGGGEYLTVQSAWQNMENSIDFFTNSYAVNSFTAFQTRSEGQYGQFSGASITEIGTELCRTSISAKAPNAFEALIEPDSPPQFHAWFDEKTFTTATVPATSQYKVFYHIFAGKGAGVNFQVYLKSPPQSSYYASNPTVTVASGFVPRGEYASETRDFTAPQGYKELCVRVNNQEECGFGQVSTSFAVDYLRDLYISDELQNTNIQSEQACVSGSPNPGALLTPNIQAGVEEVVNPAIYNRGVVRICSTENPGKSTNPSRFVNVGNCGTPKVGCWLDQTSVNNALSRENVGIKDETLEVLKDRTREFLENNDEIFSEAEALDELDRLERDLAALSGTGVTSGGISLLSRSDLVLEKLFFNKHRAKFYLIRGQINEKIALDLKKVADANSEGPPVLGDLEGPPAPAGSCKLSDAIWSTSSAVEGERVELFVTTSGDCIGNVVKFDIFENDFTPFFDQLQGSLAPIPFSINILSASWNAVYLDDVSGDPEFYFFASVEGSDETTTSPDLTVSRSGDVSGDADDVSGDVDDELPVAAQENVHVTTGDESFKEIAEDVCGSETDWEKVFIENEDNLPVKNAVANIGPGAVLEPGLEVKIPESCLELGDPHYSLSFNEKLGRNEIYAGSFTYTGIYIENGWLIYADGVSEAIGEIDSSGRIEIYDNSLSLVNDNVAQHLLVLDGETYDDLEGEIIRWNVAR